MSAESSNPTAPHERPPLLEIIVLAAPVVATMTSYTLMQFVDKLMVSRIGGEPIWVGAQGNGGLSSWVPIAIMMGFVTVINTFVSQNLGANRPERGAAYAWAGIWMSIAYYLLIMLPLGAFLPQVLALARTVGLGPHTDAAQLAMMVHRDELATGYGRILIYGSIITLCARGVGQYFYGMHKPVIVLVASVSGNIVNLILNCFLVYGPQRPAPTGHAMLDAWFDFTASTCASLHIPRLTINGSAISTVIGTTIELAIPLALFLSPKYNRLYGTARAWRPSLPHMKDLLRIGWAPALMFGNEMICWWFFMVNLVGRFGPEHSTAGWIAHQWMSLSFMPTVGISVAMTAMVGKCMGMKRPDLATHRAWLGLKVAVTYMTTCGLCFVLFRHQLVRLFIDPGTPPEMAERIVTLGAGFLIATAAFQFFDGVTMSLNGALKGAGDTRWPGIVTVVLAWSLLVVGGETIVRAAPGLQSQGPWIMAAAYIAVLSCAIFWRFLSGKWKAMKLLEESEGTNAPIAG